MDQIAFDSKTKRSKKTILKIKKQHIKIATNERKKKSRFQQIYQLFCEFDATFNILCVKYDKPVYLYFALARNKLPVRSIHQVEYQWLTDNYIMKYISCVLKKSVKRK